MESLKILLPEKEIPHAWYNLAADLPFPLPPPIHPATKKPLDKDALRPIFPAGLIFKQRDAKDIVEASDKRRSGRDN